MGLDVMVQAAPPAENFKRIQKEWKVWMRFRIHLLFAKRIPGTALLGNGGRRSADGFQRCLPPRLRVSQGRPVIEVHARPP